MSSSAVQRLLPSMLPPAASVLLAASFVVLVSACSCSCPIGREFFVFLRLIHTRCADETGLIAESYWSYWLKNEDCSPGLCDRIVASACERLRQGLSPGPIQRHQTGKHTPILPPATTSDGTPGGARSSGRRLCSSFSLANAEAASSRRSVLGH